MLHLLWAMRPCQWRQQKKMGSRVDDTYHCVGCWITDVVLNLESRVEYLQISMQNLSWKPPCPSIYQKDNRIAPFFSCSRRVHIDSKNYPKGKLKSMKDILVWKPTIYSLCDTNFSSAGGGSSLVWLTAEQRAMIRNSNCWQRLITSFKPSSSILHTKTKTKTDVCMRIRFLARNSIQILPYAECQV